ncbi:hypothetical protein [Brevundimonas sp.]|uniref:hypothetical protein n=1 Tax=Brevundimonas sp. TaxID=1871086 RepID=UPI00289A9DDF|nr:hypothetical protein [Brevundimonas sp.]
MSSGLTPDPRRDFGRRRRPAASDMRRTFTPRGVAALIAAALLALVCAQLFGAASPF